MDIKVSVVMPVYNAEKYLSEALDSLLNQTFKEFEVICVDDGSSDNSVEVIKKYTDERIKLICQKNSFAGVARNNGLKQATGKYVLFLDADDFFEKELIEKTYLKAEETNADIVLFDARQYNTSTGNYADVSHLLNKKLLKKLTVFNRKDLPDNILTVNNPAPWLNLYRRDFILENNLEFMAVHHCNDFYFTRMALALAERISWIEDRLVNYRVGNVTNLQFNKQKYLDSPIKAYKQLYKDLNQRGIYKEVEYSFKNAFLNSAGYNLDTLKSAESRKDMCALLNDEEFKEMNLTDIPLEKLDMFIRLGEVKGSAVALEYNDDFTGTDLYLRNTGDENFYQKLTETVSEKLPGINIIDGDFVNKKTEGKMELAAYFRAFLAADDIIRSSKDTNERYWARQTATAVSKAERDILSRLRNEHSADKYFYYALDDLEQYLYESLFLRADEAATELNFKLEKTYREKSEINAKLQRTYKEKSEINAKLKKVSEEKTKAEEEIKAIKDSKAYKIGLKLSSPFKSGKE